MTQTFFTIPLELRCKIYEFVFRGERLHWHHEGRFYGHKGRASCLNIRFVSKQCCAETSMPFYQDVELEVSDMLELGLDCKFRYPLAVDLKLIRNIFFHYAHQIQPSDDHFINYLPNLQSLTLGSDTYYVFPNVKDNSPELKAYMERYISKYPKRIIGGYDFKAGTSLPGLKSLIVAWRGGEQSFRMTSCVDIRLPNERGSIAVGRFDFASKKLKIIRRDDSKIITEIVLDKLEY